MEARMWDGRQTCIVGWASHNLLRMGVRMGPFYPTLLLLNVLVGLPFLTKGNLSQ